MTDESEGLPPGDQGNPPSAEESMDGAVVAAGACPYLGMVGDPNSHHSFPSRLHLCHAGEPAHIGLGFQSDYCLGGLYPSCARYQRAEEASAAGVPVAAGSGVPASAAVAGAATASAGAALSAVPAAPAGIETIASAGTEPAPNVPASAPKPAPSASYGRVSGSSEGGGGRTSPVVTVLLGLALVAVLFAFAAAAGFVHLPGGGGGVAVVTTPPASTSPTTHPSASTTGAPTATATPALTPSPTSAPSLIPTTGPSTAPTTQPTNAAGELEYTVGSGDTLFSIGLKFNVPWPNIAVRNGLKDPYVIHIGDVLIIPLGTAASATPGGSPSATSFIYVVQPGDRLVTIALKFHVTQQAILDANPKLTDPNKIVVGQQLVIPAAGP